MEEYTNYLVHHGVKGQKWGVRRYQDKDGSLTAAGRKKYGIKRSRKNPSYSDGLKWNRNNSSNKKDSGFLDRSIKRGKDKPNISPAEELVKNTSQAVNETKNTYRSIKNVTSQSKRLASQTKREATIKRMSNEELQSRIKRLDLEKRYMDLSDPYKANGKDKVEDILDIVGSVVGIVGAGVGIAVGIHQLKSKAG